MPAIPTLPKLPDYAEPAGAVFTWHGVPTRLGWLPPNELWLIYVKADNDGWVTLRKLDANRDPRKDTPNDH